MTRTYTELVQIDSFEDRFEYLKLGGEVGASTFGFDRYLNQKIYTSEEWKTIRDRVIVRDMGCDLAMPGYELYGKILVHHMNPITVDEVVHHDSDIFNPEYLITVSLRTHNAIHYGNKDLLLLPGIERTPFDTCPWRKQ